MSSLESAVWGSRTSNSRHYGAGANVSAQLDLQKKRSAWQKWSADLGEKVIVSKMFAQPSVQFIFI